MSIKPRSGYEWFLLTGVAILAAAAMLMLVVSLRSSKPKPVTVLLDTNGTARLGGLPLPGTNVRDVAFSGMAALGLKGQLALPPRVTNATDVIATLESMRRAGLLVTNTVPNPYE